MPSLKPPTSDATSGAAEGENTMRVARIVEGKADETVLGDMTLSLINSEIDGKLENGSHASFVLDWYCYCNEVNDPEERRQIRKSPIP